MEVPCLQSEQESVYRRHSRMHSFLNLVGVSVVWTALCALVVPFGPACVALYDAVVRSVIHGEGHFFRIYFSSFRSNFRRSAPIGTAYVLLAAVIVLCIRFANALADTAAVWRLMSYVYTGMLLVLGVIGCFLFATFTHTDEKALRCVKLGIVLAFRHLFTSVTCFLLLLAAGWLTLVFPACILILPGACCLICALVMEPYFSRAFGEAPPPGTDEKNAEALAQKKEEDTARYPKLPS